MFWTMFVKLCNEKSKSPNAVCAHLGYSTATATKWKNGAVPRSTTLQTLANYFNCSVDYLLGKSKDRVDEKLMDVINETPEVFLLKYDNPEDAKRAWFNITEDELDLIDYYRDASEYGKDNIMYIAKNEAKRPKPKAVRTKIKYFSQPVCAGYGNYITEANSQWLELENVPADADYVVAVQGDSMEPDYHDGDLVYVKETINLQYGDIGIFTVDGDTMIKEYAPNGLKPINEVYPIITSDNIYTQGKVIGIVDED